MVLKELSIPMGKLILKIEDIYDKGIYKIILHLNPLIRNGGTLLDESDEEVEVYNSKFFEVDKMLVRFYKIHKKLIDDHKYMTDNFI